MRLPDVEVLSSGLIDMFEGFGSHPYHSVNRRGLYRFDIIENILGLLCTSRNTNPNVVSFVYGKRTDIIPHEKLNNYTGQTDAILEVTKSGGFIDGRNTADRWEGQYANDPTKPGSKLYDDLEDWEIQPMAPTFQYYCRGTVQDAATIRPLPRIASQEGKMVWCCYGPQ